jgi:hypothetical protein
MRVRRFELRLLAVILMVAWAAAAILVLAAYRPGGPVDALVGLAALPAVAVAACALAWPPVARSDRAFRAITSIGVAALLLLIPSIAGLVDQLGAGGPQTLLPSLEAGYPWLLALGATALFAGLGVARRFLGAAAPLRRRFASAVAISVVVTFVVGGAFGGVAIANDLALRGRPALDSPYGPTDPSLPLPECDGNISAGSSGRVSLRMSGVVDLRSIGGVQLDGVRDGRDVRWIANIATSIRVGAVGEARIGSRAWTFDGRTGWTPTSSTALEGGTLDLLVATRALTPGDRATAESLGTSYVGGAAARHCRIAIDGETFRAAFPQVAWLVGRDPLTRWRGDLEYWVFADGTIGQVVGSVNGEGASLVPKGILGTVRVTMTVVDRGRYVGVPAPSR